MTLDVEAAEEIALFDHIATQDVSKHRWLHKAPDRVRARTAELLGFYYLAPASEDPVPVFPVAAREVTSLVYEPR